MAMSKPLVDPHKHMSDEVGQMAHNTSQVTSQSLVCILTPHIFFPAPRRVEHSLYGSAYGSRNELPPHVNTLVEFKQATDSMAKGEPPS